MINTARFLNLLDRLIELFAHSRLGRTKTARRSFFRLARNYTPLMISDIGPAKFYVDTSDTTIGQEVFLSGGFQSHSIKRIFDVLAAFGFSDFRGKTLVDIGANIGTTCIPVLLNYHFAHAVAFEPAPRNLELLQLNVAVNHLQHNVRAFGVALSDKEAQIVLELSPDNPGDHRVRIEHLQTQDAPEMHMESLREVTAIPAHTFDYFVQNGDITIDELGLVWIDAQGHEGHILAGAQSLLQSSVPLLMEYWPYGLKRAGTLERIDELIVTHYTHFVDTQSQTLIGPEMLMPVSGISNLRQKYAEKREENNITTPFTDILLLKLP